MSTLVSSEVKTFISTKIEELLNKDLYNINLEVLGKRQIEGDLVSDYRLTLSEILSSATPLINFIAFDTDSNNTLISEDGVNWTLSNLGLSQSVYSSVYGEGKIVITLITQEGSNLGAISEDGINWSEITLPPLVGEESYTKVCYGNGKFIALVMNTDKGAISEDGINWTSITMPSPQGWSNVKYGNGKFVAVTSWVSFKTAYSEDGINWTEVDLNSQGISEANWIALAYGNNKFVSLGDLGYALNKAIYSEDGINWTEITLPSSQYWADLVYAEEKFVGLSYESDKVIYSEDGINWTETTLPSVEKWTSLAHGNGKFVAIASNLVLPEIPNKAAYSEDGINWTEVSLPPDYNWTNLVAR